MSKSKGRKFDTTLTLTDLKGIEKEIRSIRQKVTNQDLRKICGELIQILETRLHNQRVFATQSEIEKQSFVSGKAEGYHAAVERVKLVLGKALSCEGEEWDGKSEAKSK